MNFIRRLKNLWELSAYRIGQLPNSDSRYRALTKDIATIEKKLATVIKEPTNYFEDADTS
jgi:hypothetical protein